MNRLAIFFFFDKDGKVRDFVKYYVNALHSVCNYVCVVVNGKLNDLGRKDLETVSDNLIVRENTGFDVWAYKEAMDRLGWDNITEYDELILCNFTCYGPIYPFSEMFGKMERRDCDFWGAVKHPEQPNYLMPPKKGYIYEHIMSYFTVIRGRMLRSMDFKDYWRNIPKINTKRESTALHETVFTKYFEDLGYVSDAFVNLDNYCGRCYNSSIFLADELLIKDRCPLVKRRAFAFPIYENLLMESAGGHSMELMNFISENTNFDCEMIWQDLLETQKMSTLCINMHLNSIITERASAPVDTENIVFLIFVKSQEYYNLIYPYLEKIPSGCRTVLLCDSAETFELCGQLKKTEARYVEIENHSSSVAALLACGDIIDERKIYCCIIGDHYIDSKLSIAWEDHCNITFGDLIGDNNYVFNIIENFSSNKHIGLLRPIKSSFSAYYAQTYNYVKSKMSYYLSVHDYINLTVPFDDGTIFSDMEAGFWIRGNVLKKIYDMLSNDNIAYMFSQNMAFEYMLPMLVQENGYYTAGISAEKNASLELDNQIFMQYHLIDKLRANGCKKHRFIDIERFAAKDKGNSRLNNNPVNIQSILNQKIGFRYILLLLLHYPKNKLDNIKQWLKKRLGKKISYAGSIINIVPEGERAVFYYVAGSRKNRSRSFNQNMYLMIDGRKYYTKKNLNAGQKMISEFNRDFNYGEPLFFEVPIRKLADKTVALYDSSDNHINVRWNANFSFNALELREYGLYVRVCDGNIYIQTKDNFCSSVLKSPSYSRRDKKYFRRALKNTCHPYTLIAENGGAADNAYQLFKYAVSQGENVLYIASKKVIESEKNIELRKRMIVYNSKRHTEITLQSKRWIGSFSLRMEIVPTNYLHDIHYAMLPAEWDFIPHGMAIGDKIVKMLHMYNWHNPSRTFVSVPLESETFKNMYDFKNVCCFGAPRMDKWADAKVDENMVLIFFTWRIGLSKRSGFKNPDKFVKTDYFKTAVCIAESITQNFPNRKVYYVFHHEIVKNGMDKVLREALNRYEVTFISFDTSDGAETFNDVFRKAKYLITDFSSVAFDFAYKTDGIPIYFLSEEFIAGHYTLTEKFFDMHLGIVAKNNDELVAALKLDKPTAVMKSRKEKFFAYHDGRNCERVFNAIFKTTAPESFLPTRKSVFIPENEKRLGIFHLSDSENVVDDYVVYYLCKLREVCSEVCIVVNGNLAESDERKLYGVSDRLIKLDEDGFDAWAFKKAIEKYGFDTIAECYDELVLSDSTNFGPIYPFKEMFSEMGKRDCDFWGSYRYNNIIGTDFIVFRKAILISNNFRNYWSKMKFPFSHSQAVKYHAARCSVFFESRGYISDEYTPWEKYRQYQYPVMRFAYRQATEDRNPLIKRNVFYNIDDCFQFPQCDVYSVYDLVNYIREKTDYPINLIADNMERIMAFPQDVQCPENESDRLAGNMCTDINKRCQYYINANKRFDPEKLYHSHK